MMIGFPTVDPVRIGSYLDFQQRLVLLSTTKVWKSQLIQARYLSSDESQFGRFVNHLTWRELVLKIVINDEDQPQRKLKVAIPYNLYLESEALQDIKPFLLSVKAYAYANNSHYLYGIPIVHLISGAFYRFERCPVVDVSGLREAKVVKLEKFDNLKEISCLKHVQSLELHNMPEVIDLREFSDLQSLALVVSPNVIIDISQLSCLQSLRIQANNNLVKQLALSPYVARMSYLHLENMKATAIACLPKFSNVEVLTLRWCNSIPEGIAYPPLLRCITIDRCTNITSLRGLEQCTEIIIRSCKQLIEICTTLRKCNKISIWDCYKLESVDELAAISEVELPRCYSIKSATILHSVQKLSIMSCHVISSDRYPIPSRRHQEWIIQGGLFANVEGYDTLHSLSLIDCDLVTDVSALGKVHTLKIINCCQVKDISALRNVTSLSLLHCDSIVDVSMLNHVEQLSLIGCENIESVDNLHNVLMTEIPKKFQAQIQNRFFLDFQPNALLLEDKNYQYYEMLNESAPMEDGEFIE